jgi:hypothetical protein
MGWVVGVTPWPRFTPRKGPPVPIGQEAGWSPELDTEARGKISYSCRGSNLDLPVVQFVVRHTDWAIPAPNLNVFFLYCRPYFLVPVPHATDTKLQKGVNFTAWRQQNDQWWQTNKIDMGGELLFVIFRIVSVTHKASKVCIPIIMFIAWKLE